MLAAKSQSIALAGLVVAVVTISVMLLALIQSALQRVYAAALYRYATTGEATPGFDRELVADAFCIKA